MRGVRKRFGATRALEGVDFAVAAGEIHALVGQNGAGKSTLVKILAGAIRADAGSMFLEGRPFAPAGPLEAWRAGVAMVYQEGSIVPHLSVAENVLLGAEPARLGILRRDEMARQARRALGDLGHPEIDPQARAGALPLASRQIAEIARALASGCRVLVLDEPTSTLGRDDVERLFALLRRLRGEGLAVVHISHFLEEVLALADRYTVLRDGTCAGTGEARGAPPSEIVVLMIGRALEEAPPRSPRAPGEVLLEVRELAGLVRPQSASLDLRRGEVLGIAGLVGSGRTELLRAIFGLEPVRRGEIRVGTVVGLVPPAARWAQGTGFVSEDRSRDGLTLGLSVAENLAMPRLQRLVRPARLRKGAMAWVERLGIRCSGPDQRVGDLSGGNQQKVAIARLLKQDVDLLLLDEPTRGIDVASKAEIHRRIDEAVAPKASGRPKAVLLVSGEFPELLAVCDRIAVMRRGRLGPARPTSEWTERSLLLEATTGGPST
jgi:ribose transport system ATP-binding protein